MPLGKRTLRVTRAYKHKKEYYVVSTSFIFFFSFLSLSLSLSQILNI